LEIGRLLDTIAPAITITIEITIAKIGRLIKKRDMIYFAGESKGFVG
jgi:hypothetical protein